MEKCGIPVRDEKLKSAMERFVAAEQELYEAKSELYRVLHNSPESVQFMRVDFAAIRRAVG